MDEKDIRNIVKDELKEFTHVCMQAQMIGRVQALQERIINDVYGNGHEGLSQTVPAMIAEIKSMKADIQSLTTVVSGLARFESEFTGAAKAKDKGHAKTIQIIGVIIAFLSVFVVMYVNFNKVGRQINTIEKSVLLQNEMTLEERGFAPINGTHRGGIDTTNLR